MNAKQLLSLAQSNGGFPLNPDIRYVRARKSGEAWRLYWIGTDNEVFPGELFHSQSEAKNTFKAVAAYNNES